MATYSACSFVAAALSVVISCGSDGRCMMQDSQPTGPNYIYAQMLVDKTIELHPELTALVMHVTPPGKAQNIVIASNTWLNGQKSDPDDLQVISTGVTVTEINSANDKFEVQLVLRDVGGATIGSVATIFPYKKGESKEMFIKKAETIRDELRRRITGAANLFDPFPYDPRTPVHTYAQQLVDQTMMSFPDIMLLAVHAPPPNGSTDVILGSNFGRIGKKSDEDDERVATSGEPFFEMKPSGDRYEAILPLKDSLGKTIGTLSVILSTVGSPDAPRAKAKAERIRDDLALKIANVAKLYEPAHD